MIFEQKLLIKWLAVDHYPSALKKVVRKDVTVKKQVVLKSIVNVMEMVKNVTNIVNVQIALTWLIDIFTLSNNY